MVRVNLIHPKKLADQHLIAEYNEILMLLGYVSKYPEKKAIPSEYTLGKGHIRFFKDKLVYLVDRHELIKQEMHKRNFITTKQIDIRKFPINLRNPWKPKEKDIIIIKQRITEKLLKKPSWYRYYSKPQTAEFFIKLLE